MSLNIESSLTNRKEKALANFELQHMVSRLREQQAQVERLILETPTGGVRNALTDVNIHLMGAISAAEQAKRMHESGAEHSDGAR